MTKIIDVKHLSKSYKQFQAVKDISFYVEKGSLFSLLGTNGAGKSTTIEILCTLASYNQGEIKIDDVDLATNQSVIKEKVGVVFQDHYLDELLTVRENLVARAGLYYQDKTKIQQAISWVMDELDLTEYIDKPYRSLSGGQKRKADIARALLHRPSILFLDEPTTGLDPQTRQNIWQTIQQLKEKQGLSIFLTTHYLEEAEASDYIAILDHGEIIARGTPAVLKERLAKNQLLLTPLHAVKLSKAIQQEGLTYEKIGQDFALDIHHALDAIALLNKWQTLIETFEVKHRTLDDVFIMITGKELS